MSVERVLCAYIHIGFTVIIIYFIESQYIFIVLCTQQNILLQKILYTRFTYGIIPKCDVLLANNVHEVLHVIVSQNSTRK